MIVPSTPLLPSLRASVAVGRPVGRRVGVSRRVPHASPPLHAQVEALQLLSVVGFAYMTRRSALRDRAGVCCGVLSHSSARDRRGRAVGTAGADAKTRHGRMIRLRFGRVFFPTFHMLSCFD